MSTEQFTFFYTGPFSQWFFRSFVDSDGIAYNCCEQYMMAKKAELFGDLEAKSDIMTTQDPGRQKMRGRTVKNFNAEVWNSNARNIVYKGNFLKFVQNADLLDLLLATKGTTLVEASSRDRIWGIGLSTFDSKRFDKSQWKGTNWLGETLTKLREDLLPVYKKESV